MRMMKKILLFVTFLLGCLPLAEFLSRLLKKPFAALAEKIGTCDALITAEAKGIALAYEISRLLGIWDILLEVRVSNAPAIALYESLGFVRDGIRKNYYPGGEDACNMSLHMPRPEEGFL